MFVDFYLPRCGFFPYVSVSGVSSLPPGPRRGNFVPGEGGIFLCIFVNLGVCFALGKLVRPLHFFRIMRFASSLDIRIGEPPQAVADQKQKRGAERFYLQRSLSFSARGVGASGGPGLLSPAESSLRGNLFAERFFRVRHVLLLVWGRRNPLSPSVLQKWARPARGGEGVKGGPRRASDLPPSQVVGGSPRARPFYLERICESIRGGRSRVRPGEPI